MKKERRDDRKDTAGRHDGKGELTPSSRTKHNQHSNKKDHRKHKKDDDKKERRRKRRRPSPSSDEDRCRKRKERSHRSSDDSNNNNKSKRHRHRRDDDDKNSEKDRSSRRHRDKKSKKEDSHKRRKHSKNHRGPGTEDKKAGHKKKKHSKEKADRSQRSGYSKSKAKLASMGDAVGKPPKQLLDADDDYFTYHQHFWVYLHREKGLAFNDLPSSTAAHDLFAEFVEDYNQGKLESPYYSASSSAGSTNSTDGGFPQAVLDELKTTQHAWSFQTTATERRGMVVLQEGVRKQTEYQKKAEAAPPQCTVITEEIEKVSK